MELRELRPRLRYWTARHPDWTPEEGANDGWEPDVGCYAYVTPGGETLLLFDPLVPQDDADAFWTALDTDVERHGPPHVLVTIFWHARSAPQILDRYDGARVWAHAPGLAEVEKRTRVTDPFAAGDALPADLRALPVGGSAHEVSYWIPEHRGLVTGDAMIAAPGEPVRVWGEPTRFALEPLLDLPVEMILLTHGEPVLENGRDALARALER